MHKHINTSMWIRIINICMYISSYIYLFIPTGFAVWVPGPAVTDPFPSGARSKDGTFNKYVYLYMSTYTCSYI